MFILATLLARNRLSATAVCSSLRPHILVPAAVRRAHVALSNPTTWIPARTRFERASFADQDFVEETLKNNDAQVQMSQIAQKKASYADVQQFSERMIEVHTKLNEQLAPLAKQMDISQNQKPSKEQKKEIAQLEQLSGTDFDTAYLQAMAREQHTA